MPTWSPAPPPRPCRAGTGHIVRVQGRTGPGPGHIVRVPGHIAPGPGHIVRVPGRTGRTDRAGGSRAPPVGAGGGGRTPGRGAAASRAARTPSPPSYTTCNDKNAA